MKTKRILSVFFAVMMLISAFSQFTFAADEVISVRRLYLDGKVSFNATENNYFFWSKPINSYLVQNPDSTLTRVEYYQSKILAETFSEKGDLLAEHTVDVELPLFGGFFSGKDYNFFVFGQENNAESNNTEIMRVVKYSKDWKRLSSVSAKGCNTYIPFDAGTPRFAETAGKLYIYTSHEMYGAHHQSNMTFVINESTMQIEQSYYDVMNIAQAGYVSHSFNQFIRTDGKYIYRVDHGDNHLRGISITRCEVGGNICKVNYTVPIWFDNASGRNATGASIGGFELTSDSCMIAGNLIDYSNFSSYTQERNIFISLTKFGTGKSELVWLTNYPADRDIIVCTPQLVKIDNDRFLVLWEEGYNGVMWYPYGDGVMTKLDVTAPKQQVVTKMVLIDGKGNKLSSIKQANIRLSDCQPIPCKDGTVKWYVSENVSPAVYSVDPEVLLKAPATTTPTTEPPTTVPTTAQKPSVDKANGRLSVPAKSTFDDLAELLQTRNFKITDRNDREQATDALIGTGCKIAVLNEHGETIEAYDIIVPMDVNGDGKVNSSDARGILRDAARIEALTGLYALAGDTDGNGKLNSSDARTVLRKAAGII